MGFMDKVKKSLAGPDHSQVIEQKLDGEPVLAFIAAMASGAAAPEGPKKMFKSVSDVAADKVNAMIDSRREAKHAGGAPDTIGQRLPVGTGIVVVALGAGSVSIWDFGNGGRSNDPTLIARIPREQVTSIADTGRREARGHVRFSFYDNSFFDYQTLAKPSEEFWAAADGFSTPR